MRVLRAHSHGPFSQASQPVRRRLPGPLFVPVGPPLYWLLVVPLIGWPADALLVSSAVPPASEANDASIQIELV